MGWNVLGGVIAFALGAVLAYINFRITKKTLLKSKQGGAGSLGGVTVLRQVINVAYLVVLYFAAPKTPFSMVWLLVGAVLGLTIPMFLFTARLSRIATELSGKADTPTDEKGGEN